MPRWAVISLSVTGGLTIVLAIALAMVGTSLDDARIEREDLQFEVNDLQQEVDSLTTERDELQRRAEEQGAALDQLRSDAAAQPEAVPAPAETPVETPASP